jgi:methyltransferase
LPHRKTHAAAAMNPADAEKAQRKKHKKEKRKKVKDAVGDACAVATAEEETSPRNEKKKQRKEDDAGKEKAGPRRKPTVSVAVAGSIIDNAQSLELATLVRTPIFSISITNPLLGPLLL